MSRFIDVLKRVFIHNWKMKVGAVVFAFILWSFMIASTNPYMSKTFASIPVTYTAADELKQNNLTTTVPLSDLLKTAEVTASAPADALQYLTENMIQASVDLSSIKTPGEYTLQVNAIPMLKDCKITKVTPSSITVVVEEIVSKEVPVEVKTTGSEKDWLYYGEPVLSEAFVTVTGAQSNVEKVAKAVCTVDIGDLTESAKASYKVSFVNDKDEEQESNLFSGVPSVIVEMPVYPKKLVAIDTTAIQNTTTGLAAGYKITNVSVEPASINLAGDMELLEAISSVTLDTITLDNASGDMIVEASVKLPDGVIAAVPAKVQVQLTIAQPEEHSIYSAVKIATKNLNDGLSAKIDPANIDIDVSGTEEALAAFSASKLKPFVDLSGLTKGVHENVPVKFENEPDLGVKVAATPATVTVTIS
ncbi:MAG: CdaR family protein [Christensenella sp.]|uniref:CdaR family protein n=1 Tax=Christensenella sp. TaxID=1935934 RepID=UPI002B20E579|nr:CdaR family protein [Christensenella sp.]MEA5002426.1 CdaR family protein [Christensenella sp.]